MAADPKSVAKKTTPKELKGPETRAPMLIEFDSSPGVSKKPVRFTRSVKAGHEI